VASTTHQGGGKDGEEDAKPEDDTVAGGLGKHRHAAEEAAREEGGRDGFGSLNGYLRGYLRVVRLPCS